MGKRLRVKVQNMTSARGNVVPNQFTIWAGDNQYFQSYNTVIALIDKNNKVFLDRDMWDHSVTTGRYRNEFLNEGIQQTREKIKSGEYKLTNLN